MQSDGGAPIEAQIEYLPPQKGQPGARGSAGGRPMEATVPGQAVKAASVLTIYPGQPLNVPEDAGEATFSFILDNLRRKTIKFKDLVYAGGDDQKEMFLEYGMFYFHKNMDFVGRGYLSLYTHDFSRALDDFARAVSVDAADFEAHLGVGLAKKGMGRTDHIPDLKKAHTYAPQSRAKKIWGIIEQEQRALGSEPSEPAEEYFADLEAQKGRLVAEVEEPEVPQYKVSYAEDGRIIIHKDATEKEFEYVADLVCQGRYELERVMIEDSDQAQAEAFLGYADRLFFARDDYLHCGMARAYLRDFRTAYEFLESVRTVDFKDPRAHKWAGIVKYNMGRVEDAIEDLRRTEELDPSMSEWVWGYIDRKEREAASRPLAERLKAKMDSAMGGIYPEEEQRSNARLLKLRDRFLRHFLEKRTEGINDPYERQLAAQRLLSEIIDNQKK